MILFGLHTGLKKKEMVFLRWVDVNLEGGFVMVQGYETRDGGRVFAFEPKDHEARRIKLNQTAFELLDALKGTAQYTQWIFASKYGTPRYNPGRLNRDMREIVKKVGAKGSWHSTRRTFAVNLLMRGADLESLRQLLGHSDIRTTQKYLNVTAKHLDDTVDLLTTLPTTTKK